METLVPERLSYEASCRVLHQEGYLGAGEVPPIPARLPGFFDSGPAGVGFFRTFVGDGALDNLTLPRTFFGRCKAAQLSMRNCDLTESNLCWSNFDGVDFGGSNLTCGDLRASRFEDVRFTGASLRGCDLRGSILIECDFAGADMAGAKLTRFQEEMVLPTDQQKQMIDWQDDEGPEPDGSHPGYGVEVWGEY